MLLARLRLAAAGSMSNALIIRIPTHLIESITIKAMITTNILSINAMLMCLLFAKVSLILIACNLLNPMHQKVIVTMNINKSSRISFDVILRISPTKRPEYLEKLPPFERITNPRAVLKEENTEITVSVDTVFLLLILFKTSANTMANNTIEILESIIPNNNPIAIPVNAECPNASEKKAIRLLTIMVPRIPNKGVSVKDTPLASKKGRTYTRKLKT